MKFSKMEMPAKGKKKSAPKGDSGMDLFAFEGEEPEAGETPEHEEGESSEFEAGEDEEAGEMGEGGMDLATLSDDDILAEAKKRGLV